jgi:hypothetical protein
LPVGSVTSACPAVRVAWLSDFTTHTVAGFSEFEVKPVTTQTFCNVKIVARGMGWTQGLQSQNNIRHEPKPVP